MESAQILLNKDQQDLNNMCNKDLHKWRHLCMNVSYSGKTENICQWFPVYKNTDDKTPPVSER